MKTWGSRLEIPKNTPEHKYRAFLELVDRVRKLENVPNYVNWAVLVDKVSSPTLDYFYVQAFWEP